MIRKLSVLIMLGVCSFDDMKNRQVHTGCLMAFMVEGILYCFFCEEQTIAEMLTGMMPGIFILILSYAARGEIGEGDGIILMVLGIFLGWSSVLGILICAVFLAACYALFLITFKKKSKKYEIAFIPFLLIAFVTEIMLSSY